jgi:uncharacterized DUF497 family protein
MFGPLVLEDPDVAIEPDERKNYGEARCRAFGMVDGLRLCLCFTERGDSIRLITISRVHKKTWSKYSGENN